MSTNITTHNRIWLKHTAKRQKTLKENDTSTGLEDKVLPPLIHGLPIV
jgi:hypothetical protein